MQAKIETGDAEKEACMAVSLGQMNVRAMVWSKESESAEVIEVYQASAKSESLSIKQKIQEYFQRRLLLKLHTDEDEEEEEDNHAVDRRISQQQSEG